MTQNIEQRTLAAVNQYENASGTIDKFAHADEVVNTPVGAVKTFPKISKEWDENSKQLTADWKAERDALSIKALPVLPWANGETETNINQQRRFTDGHTYLPKSVPALMNAEPDNNWIAYTADKSDVLSDIFGSKPVDLANGLVITSVNNQYPKLAAFNAIYELADNSVSYTVKSFIKSSDDNLVITLDNDSIIIANSASAVSKQFVKKSVYADFNILNNARVGNDLTGFTAVEVAGTVYPLSLEMFGNITNINLVSKVPKISTDTNSCCLLNVNFVRKDGINIEAYWSYADDVNCDFDSLNEAMKTWSERGGKLIFQQQKTYKLSKLLLCVPSEPKNLYVEGNGSTIHFTSNIKYLMDGIISIGMFEHPLAHTLNIKGLDFNLDGIPPDWINPEPNGGMGCIKFVGKKVSMNSCDGHNVFYSALLWTYYCENISVKNCNGYKLGGRSFDNSQDARGDFVYCGRLGDLDPLNPKQAVVEVDNCVVKGWKAIESLSGENGGHCGRIGVTVEGAKNGKEKIVKISNSYFYNFNRFIHTEKTDGVKLEVNNAVIEEFGKGIWVFHASEMQSCVVNNSKFIRKLKYTLPQDGVSGGEGGFIAEHGQGDESPVCEFNNCEFDVSDREINYIFGNWKGIILNNCKTKSAKNLATRNSQNLTIKGGEIEFKDQLNLNFSSLITDKSLRIKALNGNGMLLITSSSTYNSDSENDINCKLINTATKFQSTDGATTAVNINHNNSVFDSNNFTRGFVCGGNNIKKLNLSGSAENNTSSIIELIEPYNKTLHGIATINDGEWSNIFVDITNRGGTPVKFNGNSLIQEISTTAISMLKTSDIENAINNNQFFINKNNNPSLIPVSKTKILTFSNNIETEMNTGKSTVIV